MAAILKRVIWKYNSMQETEAQNSLIFNELFGSDKYSFSKTQGENCRDTVLVSVNCSKSVNGLQGTVAVRLL